ncbi:MAG: CBS domain-containing protein [Candidatus Altiarchaeales archaeon]|nr:CBS domain-containing protein [Candidatus Altiarchaeales archaeon]MBD3417274.1 CBS domain-containing protein [Candidatus Altiarchaeales archaeon]
MGIKVSDVMTRRIIFGSAESTAQQLATQMRENFISSVVILDEGRILGIVTQHDLVEKVVSASLDPKKVRAPELMSAPVHTIHAESEIEAAARLMRDKRIKKLVAVDKGKTVGIVTSYDLLVAEPVIRLLAEKMP